MNKLMAQQTAVEWFIKKIAEDYPEIPKAYREECNKAKEIEEGQIALAYSKGTLDGVNKDFTNGYTYYNETYGTDA